MLNSSDFWDNKIKNSFEIEKSPIYKHKLNVVLSQLKNHGKLLDVGIGYGILEKLINKSKPNLEVYGIDISKVAISNATKKIKGTFLIGNLLQIPFLNTKFDYVLALDVLEHFTSKNCLKGIRQIGRVLNRSGVLIISVPINENTNDYNSNHHRQVYSLDVIRKQLKSRGFEISKYYFLTAFKNNYFFKNFINSIFKRSKPNLLIVVSKKK